MSDYISREALVDRLNKNLSACNPGTFSEMCYADAIETVKHFPATDVEPVRRWIPCSERLPEDLVLVNVVWVNRDPPTYYEKIKDVPISGTACRYKGNWYWDSPACIDQLAETGENKFDLVDDGIDITHWMPLPEPPKEGGAGNADD